MALDPNVLREIGNDMKRLQMLIKAHFERIEKDPYYARYHAITGGPEAAAIRRASMDLTRSLAKLRKRGT